MAIIHISNLITMKRLSTIIITIIENELGKLKHRDPYIAKNEIET